MDSHWKRVQLTDLGLPVHILNMPSAHSVACGVLVKAGTRDERWPEEAGLAHALEHMLFQGTRDFPDSQSFTAYIEDVGGHINAFTNGEGTFFLIRVPSLEIERAIRALSQQLIHPLLGEAKVKTEMKNIIQEIRMNKDDAQQYLLDRAKNITYGEHPLGRNTLGTEKTVASFTKNNFLSFYSHYYNANNFDFVVAGRIESEDQLIELIHRYFQGVADGPFNNREVLNSTGGREIFASENRDLEQIHIAMVAPTAQGDSRTARILTTFEIMISGGMSFPLFVEVRDKLGLCYEIWAAHALFSDLSIFCMYLGTDPKRYKEALETMFKVLNKSKNDSALLEKAKKRMIGSLALSFENPAKVAASAASNIRVSGQVIDYEEIIRGVKDLTIEEVESTADRYLLCDPVRTFTFVYLAPNGLSPTRELDLGAPIQIGDSGCV